MRLLMKVDSSGVFVIKKVRKKDSSSHFVIFAIVLVLPQKFSSFKRHTLACKQITRDDLLVLELLQLTAPFD